MTQKAYLALGCFWGPQYYFSKLPGVISTRVGYSGGETEDPTYHKLGDHAETLEIEFQPDTISYEEILMHFFIEHEAYSKEPSRYRSAIFYTDDSQKKKAEKALKDFEADSGMKLVTALEPFKKFYLAEEYHQNYYLKNDLVEA